MSYDPQWPQNGQNIDADRFRAQFSGVIDLINAASGITAVVVDEVVTLPAGAAATAGLNLIGSTLHFTFALPRGQDGIAGPAGMDGAVGPPFAQAVVDSVTTLDPGQPATVQTSFDGSNVRFHFGIPRGNDGMNGANGTNGSDGGPGPPFAQAIVDSVTTLDPGQSATVQTTFDGSNVRFSFGIPRGNDGQNGTNGTNGSDGINGSDGAPGEVTSAQLSAAISGTSANTNSVSTLDTGFADPDLEALRQKLNEIILNGRR